MPRKPIERSNTNYYHVTARSNNREFWYLPTLEVWEILTKELKLLKIEFDLKIAAFVLMDNHYHLLVLTPNEDIDKVMYFFMKNTTLEIQKRTGRINRIYGGRYKGCIIHHYSYLVNVYKYIYLNPVRAKITSKAEFYPYSTLYFKHSNKVNSPFSLEELFPKHAFDEFDNLDELKWINLDYNEDESTSIQKGIQKSVFSYARNRATGKEIIPVVRAPKKKTQEELWQDLLQDETQEIMKLPLITQDEFNSVLP